MVGTEYRSVIVGKRAKWILSDYGFHAPVAIDWLQETRNITLTTARRKGTREPRAPWLRNLFRRLRRRIETAFRVMTDVSIWRVLVLEA